MHRTDIFRILPDRWGCRIARPFHPNHSSSHACHHTHDRSWLFWCRRIGSDACDHLERLNENRIGNTNKTIYFEKRFFSNLNKRQPYQRLIIDSFWIYITCIGMIILMSNAIDRIEFKLICLLCGWRSLERIMCTIGRRCHDDDQPDNEEWHPTHDHPVCSNFIFPSHFYNKHICVRITIITPNRWIYSVSIRKIVFDYHVRVSTINWHHQRARSGVMMPKFMAVNAQKQRNKNAIRRTSSGIPVDEPAFGTSQTTKSHLSRLLKKKTTEPRADVCTNADKAVSSIAKSLWEYLFVNIELHTKRSVKINRK